MENPIISYYLFYGIFFIAAIIFSILINRLFTRFSKNVGIRHLKNETHVRWGDFKPAFGGISFFILFLLSFSAYAILPFEKNMLFTSELFGLLLATTLGFLIGLADDAYNTNPLLKFIGQFTCANIIIAMGISIQLTPLPTINYFFTTFWIIGIMNSINMLDNMDGIVTSISITILIALLTLIFINPPVQEVMIFIILGVIAALIGFLFFNWHPSKMYMGDSGSQFLGIFLGTVSIIYFWNYEADHYPVMRFRQFLLPIMIFIVPLIDTFTVVSRRIMRGRSPFVGGKDHTTHHLAYLGLNDTKVALLLILMSLSSIIYVLFLDYFFYNWKVIYTVIFAGYFILLFIIMQYFYNKGNKRLIEKIKYEDNT